METKQVTSVMPLTPSMWQLGPPALCGHTAELRIVLPNYLRSCVCLDVQHSLGLWGVEGLAEARVMKLSLPCLSTQQSLPQSLSVSLPLSVSRALILLLPLLPAPGCFFLFWKKPVSTLVLSSSLCLFFHPVLLSPPSLSTNPAGSTPGIVFQTVKAREPMRDSSFLSALYHL